MISFEKSEQFAKKNPCGFNSMSQSASLIQGTGKAAVADSSVEANERDSHFMTSRGLANLLSAFQST